MVRGDDIRLMLLAAALSALGCGTPGVVEVQRIETPPMNVGPMAGGPADELASGACPSGWSCRDLSAIGAATDGKGDPVAASCSMGGLMPCQDDDPKASCAGLSNPVCVHLNVGGQALVSCGQRCEL